MTDEQLIRRLRAGDETAFEQIHARYRARLTAFARKLLRDARDSADDVVQESLWRAHRALLRDDRPIALRAWLFTLVRNGCLDEIARVRADHVVLGAAGHEPASDLHAPPAVHERKTRLADAVALIAKLPSEQRHALLRHAVDGASHDQVGAELGVSQLASRSLVRRARLNLAKQTAARDERCDAVRGDLLQAHERGHRASAHSYRHLGGCASCRAYSRSLRLSRQALAMMVPGPALLAALLGTKAGFSLAGAGKLQVATVATITATSALGAGTLVFGAGDPSPVDARSPVLPGRALHAGAAIPPGTAIVSKRVELGAGRRSEITVACPAGLRVADLLDPQRAGVRAGYVAPTRPGSSRSARVALSGKGKAVAAILCRAPDASGSLVPQAGRHGLGAKICARHGYLRTRPQGPPRGSARRDQPVTVLARDGRWARIRTDLGHEGWIRGDAICE